MVSKAHTPPVGGTVVAGGCLGILLLLALNVAFSVALGWLLAEFAVTPFWDGEFSTAWIACSVVVAVLLTIFGGRGK